MQPPYSGDDAHRVRAQLQTGRARATAGSAHSASVGCSASASLKVVSACARAVREGGGALRARGSRRRRGECPQVRRCARTGRGGADQADAAGGSARDAGARTPLAGLLALAHRRSHPAPRAARAHLHFLNEPLDGCGGAAAAGRTGGGRQAAEATETRSRVARPCPDHRLSMESTLRLPGAGQRQASCLC
eukprot:XP_008762056.2 PREDICTED: uncharacterized protein LOC102554881 [Rattus norvegicus]